VVTDSVYDALVANIYRAGQGEGEWNDVLEGMVRTLKCWSGHLMGFERATGTMSFSHEGGAPPAEATLDYIRKWHRSDPRNAVLLTAPQDSWVHCHEHLSEAFVATNDFYQSFLIPYGSRYVSGMHFSPSNELICILSFQRGVKQDPFNEEERQLIDRIGKHVKAAFLLRAQSKEMLRQAVAGHAVLSRIRFPVLLIDESRTILYENPAARGLLATGNLLKKQGNLLSLKDRQQSAELTAVLKELSPNWKGERRPTLVDPFLVVADEAGASVVAIHVSPLVPAETLGAFGKLPVYLIAAYRAKPAETADPFLVSCAFDLTPAEARVAAAVAKGMSDVQVAETMGTQPSTVRTQLKSVYTKTGAAGRSELGVLLNSSPAFWRGGMLRPPLEIGR
jgi:DNA-binding CsgD family transcriptional regulator